IVFGATIQELFPGLYAANIRSVRKSAERLEPRVAERRSATREHLSALVCRLSSRTGV
ncbi:MAG: hypothetical protein JOY77_07300, partial [Alphaproteobacteria bacterium]|nr:hypothetical protein [Alphaproteobacteria bacterium]